MRGLKSDWRRIDNVPCVSVGARAFLCYIVYFCNALNFVTLGVSKLYHKVSFVNLASHVMANRNDAT